MTNRNPNNWHWVDKNCLPWAKAYFARELAGVEVKSANNNVSVKTAEVTECEGDVDLNQRKGKIITLFDLKITLTWTGTAGDLTAKGKIDIPEVAHDTEFDEYVFDITVEEENREKAVIKDTVRKDLTAALRKKLAAFSKALIDAHAKDIQYDQAAAGRNSPVPAEKAKPAPTSTTSTTKTAANGVGKKMNTTTLTETVELLASVHDIYETFLDPGRVQAWTRAGVQVSRNLGSDFSLFDGNVTGKILNLEYDKQIVQSWRLKSWPEGHYSTVTLTLSQNSDSTSVHMKQEGVPVGELESVRQNWKNYYWQRIKATFGYGAVF